MCSVIYNKKSQPLKNKLVKGLPALFDSFVNVALSVVIKAV
jgi:hypothetical protein